MFYKFFSESYYYYINYIYRNFFEDIKIYVYVLFISLLINLSIWEDVYYL